MSNQKNIRLNDEAIDALGKLSEELGLRQNEVVAMAIDELEHAVLRQSMPERITEISEFDTLIDKIRTAYEASLIICRDAEERVRADLRGELNTMATLRDNLESARAAEANAIESKRIAVEAAETAEKRAEVAEKRAEAAEKRADNEAQLRAMVQERAERCAEVEKALEDITKVAEDAKLTIAALSAEKAAAEKRAADAEDREKTAQDRIAALNDEVAKLMRQYAQAEVDKERAVMDKERKMNELLHNAIAENARLSAQLEQFRAQS